MAKQRFTVELIKVSNMDTAYINISFKVNVIVEADAEERCIVPPNDLLKLLKQSSKAHALFNQLSHTNK